MSAWPTTCSQWGCLGNYKVRFSFLSCFSFKVRFSKSLWHSDLRDVLEAQLLLTRQFLNFWRSKLFGDEVTEQVIFLELPPIWRRRSLAGFASSFCNGYLSYEMSEPVGTRMGWVTSTDLILPGQWRRLHTYPCPPATAIALFLCDRLEYRDCIWSICPLIIKRLEPLLIVEMGKLRHRRGTSAGEGKEPSLETMGPFSTLYSYLEIHSYRNPGPEKWLTLLMEIQTVLSKTLAPQPLHRHQDS